MSIYQNSSDIYGASISIAEQQKQTLGAASRPESLPPVPDTLTSLLDCAHYQAQALSDEIQRLGQILEPVRSPIPQVAAQAGGEGSHSAACIASLRALIDRILCHQQAIRMLADEVRI